MHYHQLVQDVCRCVHVCLCVEVCILAMMNNDCARALRTPQSVSRVQTLMYNTLNNLSQGAPPQYPIDLSCVCGASPAEAPSPLCAPACPRRGTPCCDICDRLQLMRPQQTRIAQFHVYSRV
jgi:hypothetical protein